MLITMKADPEKCLRQKGILVEVMMSRSTLEEAKLLSSKHKGKCIHDSTLSFSRFLTEQLDW